MAGTTSIEFTISGIGSILKQKNLEVPRYQRSYAWEKKHVSDLLQDISEALRENREEYFLGSIVLLEESNLLHVVDGQQRLATCTILICAIRDYFLDHKDDFRGGQIEGSHLLSQNIRSQEIEPNLILNHEEHGFFEASILTRLSKKERANIQPKLASHKKLLEAYRLASKHIERVAAVGGQTDVLLDWLEYLDRNVKIIKVQVPDSSNAFTIFETLNDRGLDLAISDLLKNHLFNHAGKRIEEAQVKWSQMIGALSVVDADRQIVPYIRHVWSTKAGLIREKDLYQSIKKETRSPKSAMEAIDLFSDSAPLYGQILKPSPESWSDYGVDARLHMETLNMLRMTQIRPLLLAILAHFKPAEVKASMQLLVSWSVRFLILGKLGSGELENFYAQMARCVASGEISTRAKLRAKAKETVPTDTSFREAFILAQVSKSHLARYYLRTLEIQADPTSELLADPDPEKVDLEHIMPINPGKGWNVEAAVVETHTTRLGNLVLLRKSDNSNLGNRSFREKLEVFKKSKLKLTSELNKSQTWGAKNIEERQIRLADLAVKAWMI